MFLLIEVMLVTIQVRMMLKVVRLVRNNQTIQMFKLAVKLSYFRTLVIA